VVRARMYSPGHRAHILNPDATEIGISFEDNRHGRRTPTDPTARPPETASSTGFATVPIVRMNPET